MPSFQKDTLRVKTMLQRDTTSTNREAGLSGHSWSIGFVGHGRPMARKSGDRIRQAQPDPRSVFNDYIHFA